MMLRVFSQRLDGAAAEQPEIAGVGRDVDAADTLHQRIEQVSRATLERAFARACDPLCVDHVGPALAPSGDQLRDQLRRVLKIGVDHDHRCAARVVQAGGQCHLLAEVARQVEHGDPGITRAQLVEHGHRAIAAPVIDEQDLGALAQPIQAGGETAMELDQHRLLIVGGHDDGKLW